MSKQGYRGHERHPSVTASPVYTAVCFCREQIAEGRRWHDVIPEAAERFHVDAGVIGFHLGRCIGGTSAASCTLPTGPGRPIKVEVRQ